MYQRIYYDNNRNIRSQNIQIHCQFLLSLGQQHYIIRGDLQFSMVFIDNGGFMHLLSFLIIVGVLKSYTVDT